MTALKLIKGNAVFHKPTGKWVSIELDEEQLSFYGTAVDGIEEATIFPEDVTLDSILDGLRMEFLENDKGDFGIRVVEVSYRVE